MPPMRIGAGTYRVNFSMTGPKPVWVVKLASGFYLRWCTTDRAIGVERSMATRFDSKTWASVMLSAIPKEAGARPVRLRKKSTLFTSHTEEPKP